MAGGPAARIFAAQKIMNMKKTVLLVFLLAAFFYGSQAQHNAGRNGKVLLIASNPSVSKQTGWPIGVWYAELAHPYWVFSEAGYTVDIASPEGGEIKAFQGVCPHQDIALAEGKFDGKRVICRAHLWQFDAATGRGVNPDDCALAVYPVKVEGDDVLVSTEGIEPLFAHT